VQLETATPPIQTTNREQDETTGKSLSPDQQERLLSQPISQVRWVHRSLLCANDYNPNHVAPPEFDLLALSIVEDGWTQPIVTYANDDGTFDIVDGFHRWMVSARRDLLALTGEWVPVVVIAKTRPDRMLSTIRHNRARGEHGVRPMGSIVRELLEGGMSVEELGERCGMEREEIDRLSDLSGMPLQMARRLDDKGLEGKTTTGFNNGWKPRT